MDVSPTTKRKRRREEIAQKVASRVSLISATSSARMDMDKVQSILSGPRLSWDWKDDPEGGGLVVDFHQDARSALRTHISKAMSQMATREFSQGPTDEIKAIIEQKKLRQQSLKEVPLWQETQAEEEIDMDSVTQSEIASTQVFVRDTTTRVIPMKLNDLSQVSSEDHIQMRSGDETQFRMDGPTLVKPDDPTQVYIREEVLTKPNDPVEPTQVYIRRDDPNQIETDGPTQVYIRTEESTRIEMDEPTQVYIRTEESTRIEMDDSTQVYIREDDPNLVEMDEPTQVYIREDDPNLVEMDDPTRVYISTDDPTQFESDAPTQVYISTDEPTQMYAKSGQDIFTSSQASERKLSALPSELPPNKTQEDGPAKSKKSVKNVEEFKQWLADRAHRQRIAKARKRTGGQEFIDAEAEESDDEEMGGLLGRGGLREDEEGEEEDDGGDLEGLIASVEDEFDMHLRTKKDSKKLGKLHAKWMAERDEQLEKAIAEREFLHRRGPLGVDDGAAGGLSRLQRKLKARREALVEQFDADGNKLAPEYVSSDSECDDDYFDSDEFYDSNEEDGEELDETEIAIRKERREREIERRKRDAEFKREMQQRRLLLKEKLRQARINREKDSREIQAGLGIMTEEDQETFKAVNRTANGVFGYLSGVTTQSTTPSATVFSFLSGSSQPNGVKHSKSRRSSVGSLELG